MQHSHKPHINDKIIEDEYIFAIIFLTLNNKLQLHIKFKMKKKKSLFVKNTYTDNIK